MSRTRRPQPSSSAEVEGTYALATRLANRALVKTRKLPASPDRARAIDSLLAAIGWLKQAHDTWATSEAEAERVAPRLPRTCAEAGKRCKGKCTVDTRTGRIVDPDCFR